MTRRDIEGRRFKAVITVWNQYVAPRFDLATEALLATINHGKVDATRTIILAHPSADDLCQLIFSEQAEVVVTGGIQRRYHEYLIWKKVTSIDSVMGPWDKALRLLARGDLAPETILRDNGE